ncbi:MAG: hypothetical protein LBK60_07795 [Verrucomicrobiales bacterium]|jgi:hypothetical protein|nr:hypothetical protein [Verrucomicrobiales bacterium]
MDKSLDEKIADIQRNPTASKAFIIADAKDADMAYGLTAPGRTGERWKTLEEYRAQIRAVVKQGLVDIMLCSASNIEQLAMREKIFAYSHVTPAARANDTSDIWVTRGGRYLGEASRPFRSASIDHIKYGRLVADTGHTMPYTGADLGLYSMTFTNNLERDHATLVEFQRFREEAERKKFRYFLEVFDPNVDAGLAPEQVPAFINDHITRALAGVAQAGRPLFLKIVYHGPRAMEELAAYDPRLIVGILGGAAGTTYDAFKLIADAQKHGARVALFGRKINNAESPLTFIEMLRHIVEGRLAPEEAVRAYHSALAKEGLRPHRDLADDLRPTVSATRYGG